jgi:hypothetical protein
MSDDLSRRNVLATGAAMALAAPISTLSAASASDSQDWPEFSEWLRIALDLGEMRDGPQHEATLDRFDFLEDSMLKRPANTDRQLAMLVAIAAWHETSKPFDLSTGLFHSLWHDGLMNELVARAAVALPEVPFKVRAEV